MTTFIDRWVRVNRLAKHGGYNSFSTCLDVASSKYDKLPVDVGWIFNWRIITFDIDNVCRQGTDKDIWDELDLSCMGHIKRLCMDQITEWSDEAGIVHQYLDHVFRNPYSGKW